MNQRLERLPKFRGIPIPFFVTYRKDGTPDFAVVSEKNRLRCAKEKLCWVCGERLVREMVFVGGPASCQHRMFVDGPLHEECARDSLELCPFLLGRMDFKEDYGMDRHHESTEVRHARVNPQPPELMYLFKALGFTVRRVPDGWLFWAQPAIAMEEVRRHR